MKQCGVSRRYEPFDYLQRNCDPIAQRMERNKNFVGRLFTFFPHSFDAMYSIWVNRMSNMAFFKAFVSSIELIMAKISTCPCSCTHNLIKCSFRLFTIACADEKQFYKTKIIHPHSKHSHVDLWQWNSRSRSSTHVHHPLYWPTTEWTASKRWSFPCDLRRCIRSDSPAAPSARDCCPPISYSPHDSGSLWRNSVWPSSNAANLYTCQQYTLQHCLSTGGKMRKF